MAPASPEDQRLLSTFLDLARIYSPSRAEADCARYCADALAESGCVVRFDDSAARTGSNGGNLIAELPGTAPGVLVFSAHLDTVEPCGDVEPIVREHVVFSAGDTVLGADDKAGLAAAIECVRRLVASDAPYPTVRCVFTVQEEVGLTGAKVLDPADARGDLCLVLDADGTPGGIVIGAPTHYTFTARFIGRAAHAGVRPEDGLSAIAMASAAIVALPIGRLDEQTTANVGSVKGGTATNVIAAQCEITGECRSRDRARVESLRAEMDATMRAAAHDMGGEVEIEWTLEYEGFDVSPDDPCVELVARACRAVGLEPRTFATGGGSDANVLAAAGIPTLALACGMTGVHGTDEHIAVADLEALAALCVSIARELAASGA